MSDHGSAYADFDEEVLFLGTTHNPVDSTQSNLISTNPKGRDNYCEDMKDQYIRHNIIQQVDQLYSKIKQGRFELQDVVAQFENLDKQITNIMLSAERRCRKPKTGKVWSIELVIAARVVCYWKTRRSDLLNNQQPSLQLLQL
eukprot:5197453-Ditylum_brightwellii.AAC.1